MARKYSKSGRKYSRKRHLGRKNKRGRGLQQAASMSRLQAGGNPAFVGSPWNGSNTQTWGASNHYTLNPEGSGSGDPLDLILGKRSVSPQMNGGRKSKRNKKKSKGKSRKTRYNKKHSKKTRKGHKKRKSNKRKSNKRRSKLRGGYKGDMFFQNGVNLFRNVGSGLGDVVRGLEGYPKADSPMPVDQPGMDVPPRPISMPADMDSLYKAAQSQVGAIKAS